MGGGGNASAFEDRVSPCMSTLYEMNVCYTYGPTHYLPRGNSMNGQLPDSRRLRPEKVGVLIVSRIRDSGVSNTLIIVAYKRQRRLIG